MLSTSSNSDAIKPSNYRHPKTLNKQFGLFYCDSLPGIGRCICMLANLWNGSANKKHIKAWMSLTENGKAIFGALIIKKYLDKTGSSTVNFFVLFVPKFVLPVSYRSCSSQWLHTFFTTDKSNIRRKKKSFWVKLNSHFTECLKWLYT